MAFMIHKHDAAGRQPWEYVAAKADTYHVGDALANSGGTIRKVGEDDAYTDEVKYICMADATLQAGETLPVIRVTSNMIFKTTGFDPNGGGVSVGACCAIRQGAAYTEEGGAFEVVDVDGEDVYGRFLEHVRIV